MCVWLHVNTRPKIHNHQYTPVNTSHQHFPEYVIIIPRTCKVVMRPASSTSVSGQAADTAPSSPSIGCGCCTSATKAADRAPLGEAWAPGWDVSHCVVTGRATGMEPAASMARW